MSIYDEERKALGLAPINSKASTPVKKSVSIYDNERVELGLKEGAPAKKTLTKASEPAKISKPAEPPKKTGFWGGHETPMDWLESTKVGKYLGRASDITGKRMMLDERPSDISTGSKLGDKATEIAGEVLSFAAPGPGGKLGPVSGLLKGGAVASGKIISKVTPALERKVLPVLDRAAAKIAPKLGRASTVINKGIPYVAKKAAQGAGMGAAYGAGEVVANDKPLSEIPRQAATWAALDVGAGLAGKALSPLIGKIRTSFGKGKIESVEMPQPRKSLGTLTPKNAALEKAVNDYNQAVKTVQNHFGTNELRADEMGRIKSELGIDFDSLIGNIEKAEQGVNIRGMGERGRLERVAGLKETPVLAKRQRGPSGNSFTEANTVPRAGVRSGSVGPNGPSLPYRTGPKERQFTQNVMESQVATEEIKQGLRDNKLTYEPITNKETLDKAYKTFEADPEKALEFYNSPSNGVSADDVALGEVLITKAIKAGNKGEADRLIADLAEKLTTAGQAVQAAKMFKKMSPEGMLLYAHRVVNTANKNQLLKMGAKAKKIMLTAEDSEFILNTMKKALKLPEGRAKDVEIARVMQLIANKVPATLSEKAKGLQRISLLLNPKTMVRNVLGNTLFSVVDNLSNVVATPIDMATSKLLKTGKRTTTLPSVTGQLKSGLEGAKHTIEDARLGIDTAPSSTQFELPNKRIFDTKALDKLDRVTRMGLELGDRPFYKAAYDDSLRQQMKLAKVTEPTQEMVEQAHKIAQQRTYQDVNALTDAFKKAQQALNDASSFMGLSSKEFGLGNIVVPFVKTPANILARAIEYSPLGVQKAIKEATKLGKGTFNQKVFVDAIARSVTGTALIMVGYDLAKNGTITGSGNKDKDIAAFERGLGKNDFSFKVGDNYYTYDWAQPASMALAIGADAFLNGKNRKAAENIVFDAVRSGGETLLKQSVMQGIQRFMGGYNPIDNLESTAINAPTQFIPTLAKQATQLTDPLQRSSYSQSKLGTGAKLVGAKLPVVSKTLEPKIDTFGNEVQTYQGKNTLLNIFVNPGNTTTFKPNKVQAEIIRLYNSTGDKDIFPKVAPKYFTDKGQHIDLTPEEITEFQRTMGKKTEERMSQVVDRLTPDKEKAKYLAKAIELSYEEAKTELLRNRKSRG